MLFLLLGPLDVRSIGHVGGRRGRRRLHQTDRVKFVLLIQQKAEFVVVTGSLIDVLKSWTGNPSLQFRCIAAISSATTNPKWLLLLLLLLFAVVSRYPARYPWEIRLNVKHTHILYPAVCKEWVFMYISSSLYHRVYFIIRDYK